MDNILKDIYEESDLELFLKEFVGEYPEFLLRPIDIKDNSLKEYEHLMELMKTAWKKKFGRRKFFLTGDGSYVSEDHFLLPDENVSMLKNLRHMPLIMHSHQFIEIDYVLKSSDSVLVTRSGNLSLHDGDVIMCPPNFVHCFKSDSDDSVIIDFLIRTTTFDTTFFQLLHNDNYLSSVFSNALYNSENNYILWHCGEDDDIRRIVLSSYSEWSKKPKYYNKMLEANVLLFFIQLMRNHEDKAIFAVLPINSTDGVFQSLYNYMLINCQNVTLSDLSDHFGYSQRQIIRILKKNSDKGFSNLLEDIRMNRAIQLLKEPNSSISQVSKILGFSSTSYFHRVFLKTFSFTPEAFKERCDIKET